MNEIVVEALFDEKFDRTSYIDEIKYSSSSNYIVTHSRQGKIINGWKVDLHNNRLRHYGQYEYNDDSAKICIDGVSDNYCVIIKDNITEHCSK